MNNRILPILAFSIAIGIFFAYVSPTWSEQIVATRAAIALNDAALASAKTYTIKQNALASERSNIDPANLERLTTLLPDSVDNVGLILDINALAARSGLSLVSIDVTAEDSGTKSSASGALATTVVNATGSINLSLSALGTFSSFQAFLDGIEKSARILDIRDLTVKGSDTGVYSYQITLRLYWLRQ
jgi:Tfp pilus assembly protein PilO